MAHLTGTSGRSLAPGRAPGTHVPAQLLARRTARTRSAVPRRGSTRQCALNFFHAGDPEEAATVIACPAFDEARSITSNVATLR